jgi:DNA invertase Pin-like site-specific DNA recombinase
MTGQADLERIQEDLQEAEAEIGTAATVDSSLGDSLKFGFGSLLEIGSESEGLKVLGSIPAARYVRMSTEHQRYSTENQSEAIVQYAVRYGFDIVRTYADHGKSGLRIEGRDALKQLLNHVESGLAEFKAILVYDVSRWGRFQDADESAYYEYICRRAGIEVRYCAEQFENDGSIASTIVKTVKRAMAGEYSRELSTKVFAGQCRLIELGFRQGGPAGYGLRRRLIDPDGRAKATLSHGQQKSLHTDRVVLEPGPPEEIETVRRMYRMFVHEEKSEREIADILNDERLTTDLHRGWTSSTVRQVLTNEKYIGNNVFNRTSFKLKKKRVVNTPDMWIRTVGAFPAIIEPDIFDAARAIITTRKQRFTDAELLAKLKGLYTQHGCLSAVIIDESSDTPPSATYRQRFRTLNRAYQLVGYMVERDDRYIEINRIFRRMHADLVSEVIANVERLGGTVARDAKTDLLTINDEFTSSVIVARCTSTSAGAMRWKLRLDTGLRPDITVALCMAPDHQRALDYYLLPRIDITVPRLRLVQYNGVFLDGYRFNSLAYFFKMCARSRLRIAP